jgi:hypothetical protein
MVRGAMQRVCELRGMLDRYRAEQPIFCRRGYGTALSKGTRRDGKGSAMTGSNESIFKSYKMTADALVKGLSKTRAIELSKQQSQVSITPASIRALYESLACDGWKEKVGKNWDWRKEVPSHTDGHSVEVSLERVVAARDLMRWACQMSTSSGVQGPYLHRRRAIDLVRFISKHHYAFVELKVGSDNPLYAAFEILGYALAYLHARTNGKKTGTGEHDVFDAEKIELTILGPADWYRFSKQDDYKLDWLANDIATSLNAFVKTEFNSTPIFTMKFRQFPKGDLDTTEDIQQQAKEIDRLAAYEWWKD